MLYFKNSKRCVQYNYLQPFAGLYTENFGWNAWMEAAHLGNLTMLYNPDQDKKKKSTSGRLGNLKIYWVKSNPHSIKSFYWSFIEWLKLSLETLSVYLGYKLFKAFFISCSSEACFSRKFSLWKLILAGSFLTETVPLQRKKTRLASIVMSLYIENSYIYMYFYHSGYELITQGFLLGLLICTLKIAGLHCLSKGRLQTLFSIMTNNLYTQKSRGQ